MRTHRFLTVIALALAAVVSTDPAGFCGPWDFDEISQGPGYREVWNRYTYTMVYYEGDEANHDDDAVYVGTYNQRTPATVGPDSGDIYDDDVAPTIYYGSGIPFGAVSKGGRIYKYQVATGQWSLVWPNVENISDFDTDEFGWRISEVYQGKIYFGSYKSGFNSGARLIEIDPTDDSVSFIGPGPGNWGSIVSVRALAVYHGKLYIGSEYYTGGDLWSYDGTTLEHVWSRPSNGGFYPNVAYIEVYGDYLFIGGWYNPALFRYDDALPISGTNPVDITPGEISGESGGPISMARFGNNFFVGTADLGGNGFSLFYYTSPTADPVILTTTGFGGKTYAWIIEACGELLFMGAFTSGGDPLEGLWVTSDSDTWTVLPSFYNPDPEEYGVRSMACGIAADGNPRLYYATAAVNTGAPADVLRFSHGTRAFQIEGPFASLPAVP